MVPTSKKKSRAESIRKKLEEEIFLGIVQPGQRLDEQAEARRFGASRTPVREAISYLASFRACYDRESPRRDGH